MFSFFHRTSTINMDCFVNSAYVHENVPIVNAHKTYPQWWLDLPIGHKREFDFSDIDKKNVNLFDSVQKNNNMKNCYGFLEFYKRGAVVESWCDFRYKVGVAGYKFFCSDGMAPLEHSNHQRGEGFKDYHHTKLVNPWLFNVKDDVKFLLVSAQWSLDKYNFVIPPGILNFNLVNMSHINILLPKNNYEFEISIGQPLVHLIPLSDKNLKIKNHLITQEEHTKMINLVGTSYYGWRRKMELIFRNKKRKENKCPFS